MSSIISDATRHAMWCQDHGSDDEYHVCVTKPTDIAGRVEIWAQRHFEDTDPVVVLDVPASTVRLSPRDALVLAALILDPMHGPEFAMTLIATVDEVTD